MSSGARAKLDGFDGLRALAALTVLTYHVALSRGFSPAGSLAPLLWELKGGVAIFFVSRARCCTCRTHVRSATAMRGQAGAPTRFAGA